MNLFIQYSKGFEVNNLRSFEIIQPQLLPIETENLFALKPNLGLLRSLRGFQVFSSFPQKNLCTNSLLLFSIISMYFLVFYNMDIYYQNSAIACCYFFLLLILIFGWFLPIIFRLNVVSEPKTVILIIYLAPKKLLYIVKSIQSNNKAFLKKKQRIS